MSALTKRVLGIGALLLIALAGTAEAKDKVWESEKDNVLLRIPDDSSSTWEWLAFQPGWSKSHVVRGAERRLEKLKSGEPVTGQGAMLHLAILKIDDDQTLAQSAEDKTVRAFLLKRFSSTPELDTEDSTIGSGTAPEKGHPCIILRAEGQAPNLRGNAGKCTGVLIITQHAGKLYLLRMYAFPTEIDEEVVCLDLDYMEGNAFELINTKAVTKKGAPPPPANGGGDGDADGEEEEAREDETIEHREQKWRITIDKKLKRSELTEEDSADHLILKIADSDSRGNVLLYLYAPPTTQYIDGVKAAPPNLVRWITTSWWANFTTTHPDGDLFTWKWPRKPSGKSPTFLTVPDMDETKNRVGVITGKKKRPVEISQSDATKKLKFAEKPSKNKIGKKGKGNEAMRGILEGNRPRLGTETVLRYAWRSPTHSYRLFVIFGKEGYKKWGDSIRKTLESFEFGLKFKKRKGK